MRLISLNIWGGRLKDQLLTFVSDHEDVDIFCFQEALDNDPGALPSVMQESDPQIFQHLKEVLPEHNGYISETEKNNQYLAAFIRSDLTDISATGEFTEFVLGRYNGMSGGDASTMGRAVQCLRFTVDGKPYLIANFHGLWKKEGRKDDERTINQSTNLMKLLDIYMARKVLCGDFNLDPDTQSIRIIENKMVDLITKNGITDTRSSYFPYHDRGRWADFTFVSPDVEVKRFEVMKDEVSDHLPMFLEFE